MLSQSPKWWPPPFTSPRNQLPVLRAAALYSLDGRGWEGLLWWSDICSTQWRWGTRAARMWCRKCRGGWSSRHHRKRWSHYRSLAECRRAGGGGLARWGSPCCCVLPPRYCGSGTAPRKQSSCQSTRALGLTCMQGQWRTCRCKRAMTRTMSHVAHIHEVLSVILGHHCSLFSESSGKNPEPSSPFSSLLDIELAERGHYIDSNSCLQWGCYKRIGTLYLAAFFFNTFIKTHAVDSWDQWHPVELSATTDMFCSVQYGSHKLHVAVGHLNCGWWDWGIALLS